MFGKIDIKMSLLLPAAHHFFVLVSAKLFIVHGKQNKQVDTDRYVLSCLASSVSFFSRTTSMHAHARRMGLSSSNFQQKNKRETLQIFESMKVYSVFDE